LSDWLSKVALRFMYVYVCVCSSTHTNLVTKLGAFEDFIIFVVAGFRNYENGVTVDERLRPLV